jgi:phage shock protein A
MRLFDRIRLLLRAGTPAWARAPEPDGNGSARAAYVRRVDELAELRRHIADAAAGRRRIEAGVNEIDRRRDHLRRAAVVAAREGRDADAKTALAEELELERRVAPQVELLAELRSQERTLSESAGKIAAQVEGMRVKLDDLEGRDGAPR